MFRLRVNNIVISGQPKYCCMDIINSDNAGLILKDNSMYLFTINC